MKKNLLTVLLFTISLTCLSACNTPTNPTTTQQYSEDYLVELSQLDIVDFHTSDQANYLKGDYLDISSYANGKMEKSRPNPVYFEWEAIAKIQNAPSIKNYELIISENADFSSSLVYKVRNTYAEIFNLKIATTYYWKVIANLDSGLKVVSSIDDFKTVDQGPRNIFVDGVTNIRDLGGWITPNGNRVKQGLIYRSGRFNLSESDSVVTEITFEGVDTILNELKVKTEIDIRKVDNNEVGSITSSPIDESINYFSCPMEWKGSNILLDNIESVKEIFSILADEDNYPVVYHCNIGTDRTGLFAYLINGLMGVSEEDLYRDYLFSNFGLINGTRTIDGIKKSYVATINSYEGNSLSEKIKNCLIGIGVEVKDIESVIDILS